MDTAIMLLVVEGVPFLALVYYLIHKKQMFMLERGIEKKENRYVRAERRIINGLFLTLAGFSMILAPQLASIAGIEAQLSFDLLLVSMILLCAGLAMLIGGELLKYRTAPLDGSDGPAELNERKEPNPRSSIRAQQYWKIHRKYPRRGHPGRRRPHSS